MNHSNSDDLQVDSCTVSENTINDRYISTAAYTLNEISLKFASVCNNAYVKRPERKLLTIIHESDPTFEGDKWPSHFAHYMIWRLQLVDYNNESKTWEEAVNDIFKELNPILQNSSIRKDWERQNPDACFPVKIKFLNNWLVRQARNCQKCVNYETCKGQLVFPLKDTRFSKRGLRNYWQNHYLCDLCYNGTMKMQEEMWESVHTYVLNTRKRLECGFCKQDFTQLQINLREGEQIPVHFDHVDVWSKYMSVWDMIRTGHSRDLIVQEVDKCRVLCVGCHQLETAAEHKSGILGIKRKITRQLNYMRRSQTIASEQFKSENGQNVDDDESDPDDDEDQEDLDDEEDEADGEAELSRDSFHLQPSDGTEIREMMDRLYQQAREQTSELQKFVAFSVEYQVCLRDGLRVPDNVRQYMESGTWRNIHPPKLSALIDTTKRGRARQMREEPQRESDTTTLEQAGMIPWLNSKALESLQHVADKECRFCQKPCRALAANSKALCYDCNAVYAAVLKFNSSKCNFNGKINAGTIYSHLAAWFKSRSTCADSTIIPADGAASEETADKKAPKSKDMFVPDSVNVERAARWRRFVDPEYKPNAYTPNKSLLWTGTQSSSFKFLYDGFKESWTDDNAPSTVSCCALCQVQSDACQEYSDEPFMDAPALYCSRCLVWLKGCYRTVKLDAIFQALQDNLQLSAEDAEKLAEAQAEMDNWKEFSKNERLVLKARMFSSLCGKIEEEISGAAAAKERVKVEKKDASGTGKRKAPGTGKDGGEGESTKRGRYQKPK